MDHNEISDAYLESNGFQKAIQVDFGQAVVLPFKEATVCFKLRGGYGEIWLADPIKSYKSPAKRFLHWLKRLVSLGKVR